jgi:HEAT repeat protein/beta-lactamase regulating signal transducer with metallopeptidase domain
MERFVSWIPTMIDAGAKGALVLIAIFLVTRLMRNASAASRHVAWAVGIVVLLGLPILTAVLPRLEVVPVPAPAVEKMTTPPAPAAAPEENSEQTRRPRRAVFASNDAALPDAEELAARLVSGAADPAAPEADPCPLFSRCTVASTSVAIAAISPAEGFVGVWIVVAIALLLRLAIGAFAARRLVRRAVPVRDPSWRQLLKDAQEMAEVKGNVRLFESPDVGMPVTLGVLRPTIVIPPVATSWSEERRLTVLVHELAHIRRNDVFTCLVARIACAIHWMNPLVWRAARKLRDECERACDDLVIRAGMTASTYADDLLDIVRNAGMSRSPAVALPMAQRSDFEGRLLAILDPISPRRAPSPVRMFAVAVLVAAIVMPLAAMAPAPLAEETEDPSEMAAVDETSHHDEGAAIHLQSHDEMTPVAEGVTAVFNDLTGDLGALKDELVGSVAASLETAKNAASDYVADMSMRFDIQVPQPPQPPEPQDPQDKAERQHKQERQGAERSASTGRAVLGLAAALTDRDPQVRLAAAEGLGGLDDPRAVEALSRALRSDENVEVRRMAAWALGEIEDAAAVPALSDALRSDRDEEVRRMAAWALGEIESATAVEALGAALKDASPEVRKTAVWALGEIESPNGVAHLLPFLKDENTEIRSQAAWALGEIESPRAVAALAAALDDRDPKVREMVVWALGEIEDASAIDALSKALTDANVGVRRKAAWALGEIDIEGEAPPALIEATRDQDREVRKIAAHALGEIGDPAAVGALAALARGQDNALRYAAVHALAEIEDSAAVEVLVELLKDSDPEVRKIAAQALGKR